MSYHINAFLFQAYASGCNVVILSPKFERVQIIPGVCHDNIQISCLDCSVDSGKIAAAYANQVVVFEPTPLVPQEDGEDDVSRDGLDYWWVETARMKAECRVATLAWNNEGNRLLTAGDYIQMWQFKTQVVVAYFPGNQFCLLVHFGRVLDIFGPSVLLLVVIF